VSPAESSSLRDILNVLFKRSGLIAMVLLVSLAIGLAASILIDPVYTATSKLLVGIGREKTAPLALEREPSANVSFSERPQDINNEIEILRSPTLMTSLLPEIKARLASSPPAQTPSSLSGEARGWLLAARDNVQRWTHDLWLRLGLGLGREIDPDQALVMKLTAALSIDVTKETDVISVNFRWTDPAFAAFVANRYVKAYQDQHVRIYKIDNSLSFYREQLTAAQRDLSTVEQATASFLQSGDITSIDAEKGLALNYLGELDRELNQTRVQRDDAKQKLDDIEARHRQGNAWIETPESTDTEAGIEAIDRSYVTLSTERTRLLAHFTPNYPAVVSIDHQLQTLREQKYAALRTHYAAGLAALQKRVSALEQKSTAKKAELARLADRTVEHDQLTQRRAQLQADVARYTQKVEDLKIREDLDARNFTSIRIIHDAVAPEIPSAPNKRLIVGLAGVMGLLFAIAFAVAAEFFNHTFRNEQDVRRVLGVPLLSTIPRVGR
jgi:uncharacterized protein involved in exopolysaccharide biosynthesis